VKDLLTIPALGSITGIRHGFTTRQGGLGARSGGLRMPDDWDAVARSFGIESGRIVTVHQVHGDDIVVVNEQNYRDLRPRQADGLITSAKGIAIGIEIADCVPVLLLDPQTPAVGAVHAGWRSTVKRIVRKAVERMQHEYGSDPAWMLAAIGPAIGPDCYEVDEPVMGPVREAFPFWKEVAASRGNGRWSLDLAKANRIELEQSGLKERNIHCLGLCTSCHPDRFYSFRREGRTGRMLSVIMIKDA
jgi:YfiH family protein